MRDMPARTAGRFVAPWSGLYRHASPGRFFMDPGRRPCYTGSMNSSPRVRRAGRRLAALAAAGLLLCLVTAAPDAPGTAGAFAMGGNPEAGDAPGAQGATAKIAREPAPQPAAPAAAPEPARPAPPRPDATEDALTIRNDAPGYEGFAGTWRDPATGDIITSVIAPRRPQEQAPQQPIYIAPQIEPDWPGGNSGTRPGGNSGWGPGWNPGWNPDGNPGWNPGWNPGPPPPGLMPPAVPPTMPPSVRPPFQPPFRPPSRPPRPSLPSAPPSPGLPDFRPPQPPDVTPPGALPLPDMPPPPPAQGGTRPPAPGADPGMPWPPARWQGPSGPQQGAWRPWEQPGFTGGPKSWTPGQPPRGGWQPRSWSPWSPAGGTRPRGGYGMPGTPGGFAGMPPMPGNISPHLGPVVAPRAAGGGR